MTPLKRAGAVVVWRCHVGADHPTELVDTAWHFLLPSIEQADGFIFTRRAYVPPAPDPERVGLLTPAIDSCSEKNRTLAPGAARAILDRSGLARGPGRLAAASVRRRCSVLRDAPPPFLGTDRLVVALGRWDRLKDPVGIIYAFARHVRDQEAFLVAAGPAVGAVADDPEGGQVLSETRAAWRRLPAGRRRASSSPRSRWPTPGRTHGSSTPSSAKPP